MRVYTFKPQERLYFAFYFKRWQTLYLSILDSQISRLKRSPYQSLMKPTVKCRFLGFSREFAVSASEPCLFFIFRGVLSVVVKPYLLNQYVFTVFSYLPALPPQKTVCISVRFWIVWKFFILQKNSLFSYQTQCQCWFLPTAAVSLFSHRSHVAVSVQSHVAFSLQKPCFLFINIPNFLNIHRANFFSVMMFICTGPPELRISRPIRKFGGGSKWFLSKKFSVYESANNILVNFLIFRKTYCFTSKSFNASS